MQEYQKKSRDWLLATILAAGIIIISLNNTNGSSRYVGYFTIVLFLYAASLFLLARFSLRNTFTLRYPAVVASAVGFSLIYAIQALPNISIESVLIVLQITLLLCFFLAVTRIRWEERILRLLSHSVILFFVGIFLHWMLTGFDYQYRAYLVNENVVGGLIFVLSFFLFQVKSRAVLGVALAIATILVVASGARAVWFASFATAFTFFIWNWISQTKARFMGYFLLVVAFMLALVYAFSHYFLFPELHRINQLVFLYTDQNLLSGREEMWITLIDLIKAQPVFGYGAATRPGDFITTGLSAHNLFVQTALQVGLPGLTLLLGIFVATWNALYDCWRDPIVRLCGSFIVGIVVHQSFEVSLTQVGLSIGLVYWLIMGIGLSRVYWLHGKTEFAGKATA